MRFLLVCLLILSLSWSALSNPLFKKSDNHDSSLIPYPAQTALVPIEAVDGRETSHQAKDCSWLDSCVISLGKTDGTNHDGVCSGLPDGVPTAGCPEKPTSETTNIGSALSSTSDTRLISVDVTRDVDKWPTPDHVQQANGYLCIGSKCLSTGPADHFCNDGGCSESADGVLTCSCPDKSTEHFTKHCLSVGCPGDTVSAAPAPQSIATTPPPEPSITQSPNAMVCDYQYPFCINTADLSHCENTLCVEPGNRRRPCSCSKGATAIGIYDWRYWGLSSWLSRSSAVEEAATSSTALVKRTKEPCPNPKVNPYPPFNFICPGDETTSASNVKRTKAPCPSPKVNPNPPYNFICPGDENTAVKRIGAPSTTSILLTMTVMVLTTNWLTSGT